MNAVGKDNILEAFRKIAVYFKNGLQVKQNGLEIVESGNTALILQIQLYLDLILQRQNVKPLMFLKSHQMVNGYVR